ncbi:MAG: serine/threonine-protein phosphatase [Clostridiales bacterium]|nr:serine/threonine-protein phosphatase [Clostridiales bacterium]
MIEKKKANLNLFVFVIFISILFQYFAYNSKTLEAYFFEQFNLKQLDFLIKIGGVILSLLILNTSYYSLFTHKRKRMLYFVVIFEGFAIVEILKNIFYNPLFVNYSKVTFGLFDVYYNLMFTFLTVLIAYASIIELDEKINDPNFKIYLLTPFLEVILMIVILYSVMANYYLLANQILIENTLNIIQLISLSIAITMYLKTYFNNLNKYARNFAIGLTLILLTHIFNFVISINDYQLLIGSILFVSGLLILNHSTFRYNIGIPYTQLKNAQRQINLYAENLEKIVEKRTNEVSAINQKLVSEIENAKRIQQSLLPPKRFEFKGTLFVSDYFPCERLSGDFYDIYPIDEENIGMYVLDVSGHGISAALMTMFCNNYVKSTERLIKRYRGLKPHRNIQHFYDEFNKMNFPDEMHMVLLFATFNVNSKVMKYSNGGLNNFPIVLRHSGEIEYLNDNIGFPICKMSDIYIPEYSSSEVQLYEGDRVMFFTDGLIDEKKNQIMTEQELIETLKEYQGQTIDLFNNYLLDKIRHSEIVLEDDITYFIMEIN